MWAVIAVWVLLEGILVKGYQQKNNESNWPTLAMLIMLFVLWVQPIDVANRAFRYDLILTTLRDLCAPFFTVRFRDFFYADVLTSLTSKIIDFGYVACYFAG